MIQSKKGSSYDKILVFVEFEKSEKVLPSSELKKLYHNLVPELSCEGLEVQNGTMAI